MIAALIVLLLGGWFLVFTTNLLHRLEGEEILPFWLWSLAVMFVGFIGFAVFFPHSYTSDIMAFGAVLSLAMSIFGLVGITKTLPPL